MHGVSLVVELGMHGVFGRSTATTGDGCRTGDPIRVKSATCGIWIWQGCPGGRIQGLVPPCYDVVHATVAGLRLEGQVRAHSLFAPQSGPSQKPQPTNQPFNRPHHSANPPP